MSEIFSSAADAFIDAVAADLGRLSGQDDHAPECVIEASNLVSALIDADGRHSKAELDGWVGSLGRRLDPPMIVTADTLRGDDTFGGRAEWLGRPSTMFDLLVRADARDARRRANRYYSLALELAHATAALDLVPSHDEIAAIDRFRTMLLTSMDEHGVPRPGRPDASPRAAATAGTAADDETPEPELPPERPVEEILAELDALVGLADVKAEVRRLTSLLRIQEIRAARDLPVIETSKHLVFSGNPGTGKTTVARLLSQLFRSLGVVSKGHLVETDRSGLVAGFVGQTAAQTKKVLTSALGGTLIIDEAYALARGGENDFGLEAVDTIVKFMEDHRDDLSIVAAGYPTEMGELIDSNPGLASRFTRTIHFPDYTTDELVAIFALIAGSKEYHLDESGETALAAVIDAEPRGRGFGNGRFVRNVFESAVGHQALRLADVEEPTDDQLVTLTGDDITPSAPTHN
ncbi:MAG: AAA family ATPase [Actinomycetota bacterium]